MKGGRNEVQEVGKSEEKDREFIYQRIGEKEETSDFVHDDVPAIDKEVGEVGGEEQEAQGAGKSEEKKENREFITQRESEAKKKHQIFFNNDVPATDKQTSQEEVRSIGYKGQ
ncbi:hypothetical protein E2C01_067778 [Portunus trituberculatus]|uniref:Uncharacterized protein n=1 Tax=Portunus trituberculatus TaxID=210409 RepID=A0A5B7HUL0_PORTR|nr:hypothetical protein [Portunus trituberculatus]